MLKADDLLHDEMKDKTEEKNTYDVLKTLPKKKTANHKRVWMMVLEMQR